MRRTLVLVVGLLALALAAPTIAAAHGGGHGKHKKAQRANLSGRAAGTITSFDGTTLTITLASGAVVAGTVDDDTDIYKIKVPATAGAANFGHHDDDDDDHGHHGGWWKGHRWGWFWRGDAEDLVPGTTVYKASLDIDDEGAEWEKVKLLVPMTPPPGDT
jgi:hypothetical protein